MSKPITGSTICILYGLNEGPGIGKQFEHACVQAGLRITEEPAVADIIFAHSGGCLLIPPTNQAETVVLVGIPYWPGRPWLFATVIKVWHEWIAYRKQHQRYTADIAAAWRMLLNLSPSKPWNSTQRQFVVRNRSDAYCCPEIFTINFRGPRSFVSLPGQHDDCWLHPKPYIDLIQSLHE
jgi:hypothetical protein